MVSFSYVFNELRRRIGRTVVTALGLAAGVGLVMGIIGVSQGLSDAQNKVLSPLGSVGTDIIVTRTVAPTTSTVTTTTIPQRGFGGGGGIAGGGGGFFAGGGSSSLNASDTQTLLKANSSIITDLAKLGPPGTVFTHDFFVPGTLITFPAQAISDVARISGVKTAVGALSLEALHETGTVPTITATFKTGGQTLKTTVKAPKLTPQQSLAERQCIQSAIQKEFGAPTGNSGTSGAGPTRTPGGGGNRFGRISSNPAIQKCLTPAQRSYVQNVVVPEQTIRRVLNAPTTNTATSTYTVGGVDITNSASGLITRAQLVKGSWLSSNPTMAKSQVLVNTGYATQRHLGVNGNLTINKINYKIVGLVNPTLTGDVADVYLSLANLQALSTNQGRVNEILVKVDNSNQVNAVAAQIKKALPGATVLTSATLADQVTGSLSNAHKLANDLGGALAVVVLLAAFLIAGLLTLSSVSKRVREIGSLRAIGWSRARVIRQIIAETLGIGIIGGALGVGIGALICLVVGAIGPGLSVTSSGLSVGASNISALIGQSTTGVVSQTVHLGAPIHPFTIVIAFAGALLGGLIAGAAGGWRAARLSPVSALRDLG
ncbi:MAG TPA: ABC transporter permease [Acidimicrobiales bacterium]|nr:ABC transporter permease [Acidimicrobiales bacterium]